MKNNNLLITPTDHGVGAFVENIELTKNLSGAATDRLRSALGKYGVLFFRDQFISSQEHIAFAKKFASINTNRFFPKVEGYPQIALVLKEPDETINIGGGWHTDHTYDREPAMGSILVAREVPSKGGDTLFANTCLAYQTLSDKLKASLVGLKAVHSSRHIFGPQGSSHLRGHETATQDSTHPLVIKHPISGQPSIYVNPSFTIGIEGWGDRDAKTLLKDLYEHISKPEHIYRFKWAPGSIAFWDNRASWHYALNDYHGSRRLMHRITVEGEALSN